MTAVTRLEPPIALDTPRGPAYAHLVIDYMMDGNLVWVCFQRDTGQCWSYQNPDVRLAACETTGVRRSEAALQASAGSQGAAAGNGRGGPAPAAAHPSQAGCSSLPAAGPTATGEGGGSVVFQPGWMEPVSGSQPISYRVVREPVFPVGRVVRARKPGRRKK